MKRIMLISIFLLNVSVVLAGNSYHVGPVTDIRVYGSESPDNPGKIEVLWGTKKAFLPEDGTSEWMLSLLIAAKKNEETVKIYYTYEESDTPPRYINRVFWEEYP